MAIMPGYIIAPLFIGLFGSVVGILLGIYFGAPGMLSFYEDIIGLPIRYETDYALVSQIVIIAMIIVLRGYVLLGKLTFTTFEGL